MNLLKFTSIIGSVIAACLLSNCSSQYGKVSFADSPQIANVSHYDPKEIQRKGSSYSPLNQYSIKKNGALGQIARCSKGYSYDKKCSDFLVGAERQGLLLGAYHYVTPTSNAKTQARRFIARLQAIKVVRGLKSKKILLVADIDSKSTVAHMVDFVSEIKRLTGGYPMIYLENGELIRSRLRRATYKQKSILRKCPYWLALYSDKYPGIATPKQLAKASGVWDSWTLWQYGGVEWENRRSVPKHYVAGSWKTPRFFGDLNRPLERNGFNGSISQLYSFWNRQSWKW